MKGNISMGFILIMILVVSIFYAISVSSEPRGECCKCNDNSWKGADTMGGKSCKDACSKNGGFDKESYTPRGPGMCGGSCSNIKSTCYPEGLAKCLKPGATNEREICDQNKQPFICNWIGANCAKDEVCYKDPVLGDKCKKKGTSTVVIIDPSLDQPQSPIGWTPTPQ